MQFEREVALRDVNLRGLEGFRANVGTRGTILPVAELETDEDLGLALRPLEHGGGAEVLPVLHANLLQHASIDLQALIDHSRNFVTVVGGRIVELMKAL